MQHNSKKSWLKGFLLISSTMLAQNGWSVEYGKVEAIMPVIEKSTQVPQNQAGFWAQKAVDLKGKTIINANNEEIGAIQSVVIIKETNRLSAVIKVGGFLGIGASKIALPLDEMQLRNGKLRWDTTNTTAQLEEKYSYIEEQYSVLNDDMQLQAAKGSGTGAGMVLKDKESTDMSGMNQGFMALDTDQDGIVSKAEAKKSNRLSQHWGKADQNRDDKLEQSEFSAFETQMMNQNEPNDPNRAIKNTENYGRESMKSIMPSQPKDLELDKTEIE